MITLGRILMIAMAWMALWAVASFRPPEYDAPPAQARASMAPAPAGGPAIAWWVFFLPGVAVGWRASSLWFDVRHRRRLLEIEEARRAAEVDVLRAEAGLRRIHRVEGSDGRVAVVAPSSHLVAYPDRGVTPTLTPPPPPNPREEGGGLRTKYTADGRGNGTIRTDLSQAQVDRIHAAYHGWGGAEPMTVSAIAAEIFGHKGGFQNNEIKRILRIEDK